MMLSANSGPNSRSNSGAGSARWVLVALGGFLLAGLGGAAWLLQHGRAAPRETARVVVPRMQELFEDGDYLGVIDLAAAHADDAAGSAALRYWLGYAHFQLNDPEAAVASLLVARRLDPEEPQTLELLGRAYLVLDRHDLAVGPLERAVEIEPTAHVHLLLGRALLGAGRSADASVHLQAASQELPVEASFELGRLARSAGDLEAAARFFRRTLELDRTHVAATYALGQVLMQLGRREEGQEFLARHAELAKWHDAHEFAVRNANSKGANFVNFMELAEVELRQERWSQAAAAYQRALTDRSNLIEASNGLGRILLRMGRRGPATQAIEHSLQLDPRDPAACHLAAVLAVLSGEPESAGRYVALSRRSGPWSADQLFLYGEALLRRGHALEARRELETALRLQPDHRDARVHLGRAVLGLEDAAAAERLAREGLELRPSDAELHWIAALAATQLGRRAQARDSFAAAARIDRERSLDESEIAERCRLYGELPGGEEGIALYRAVRAEDATTR